MKLTPEAQTRLDELLSTLEAKGFTPDEAACLLDAKWIVEDANKIDDEETLEAEQEQAMTRDEWFDEILDSSRDYVVATLENAAPFIEE